MKLAEQICPAGEPADNDRVAILALSVAAMKGNKKAGRMVERLWEELTG